jgi:hypothetical protein
MPVGCAKDCARISSVRPEQSMLDQLGRPEPNPAYTGRPARPAEGLLIIFQGTIPRSELANTLGSIDYLIIPSTGYENNLLILLQALAKPVASAGAIPTPLRYRRRRDFPLKMIEV